MLKIAYWFSTIGMIIMFLVVRHDCMNRIKAIFVAGYKMKPIAQTVGGKNFYLCEIDFRYLHSDCKYHFSSFLYLWI